MMFLTFKLLWNGFAARASSTRPCGTLPSRPQAASETVKVAFSAASRKATWLTLALAQGTEVDHDEKAYRAAVGT